MSRWRNIRYGPRGNSTNKLVDDIVSIGKGQKENNYLVLPAFPQIVNNRHFNTTGLS